MTRIEAGSGLVDDLACLSTLDESTLLEEVRARYHRDVIYTYIGDLLVAVNPYKRILMYGKDYEQRYTDIKVKNALPPHLFAMSDQSFQAMRRTGVPQCCVVSGESGAGRLFLYIHRESPVIQENCRLLFHTPSQITPSCLPQEDRKYKLCYVDFTLPLNFFKYIVACQRGGVSEKPRTRTRDPLVRQQEIGSPTHRWTRPDTGKT